MALDNAVSRSTTVSEKIAPLPEEIAETNSGLHRAVWMLAWPSVLTMLLQAANSNLDRFFVGSLGSDALAAVGVGGQFIFLLFAVGMALSVGASALVSRFSGAKDDAQATLAVNQSLWIGLYAAVICFCITWPLRGAAIGLMHLNPHASILCIHYLSMTFLGLPALFLMLILGSVFRGLGDTVTPLRVMLGVNIVHLGGDWLLIFGHAGFPRMGLTGGAIALVFSQIVGTAIFIWFLRNTPVRGLFRARGHLELAWAKRILRIGIPALWQGLSHVLSLLCFTAVITRSPQATAAAAALTIGMTSESIAFMPGYAFSMAAATLTGQNLGAGNPQRAERAAWAALQQGMCLMIVMGVVFYVLAVPFAHRFTHDTEVVSLTVSYLKIAAIAEPFLALGMILTGALNGAGDTKAPAWSVAATMWGIRLPLAWLAIFPLALGAYGAWWAMAVSTMLNGVMILTLFKRGEWKKTVV